MIKKVSLYTVSESDGAGYKSEIIEYFTTKKLANDFVDLQKMVGFL